MFVQMMKGAASMYGPLMDFWQTAIKINTHLVRQQLETASETGQFLADRLRAYVESDSVDALTNRLEGLTALYGQRYAQRLKETQSLWSEAVGEAEHTAARADLLMSSNGSSRRRESAQSQKAEKAA